MEHHKHVRVNTQHSHQLGMRDSRNEERRERLAQLKNRIISNARVNIQRYKERKHEEREEAREFREREKEEMRRAEHQERLRMARSRGRERATHHLGFGSFGKMPSLLGGGSRINLGSTGKIDIGSTRPVNLGHTGRVDFFGGHNRNLITGERFHARRVHHHKGGHHAKHKEHGHHEGIHIYLNK